MSVIARDNGLVDDVEALPPGASTTSLSGFIGVTSGLGLATTLVDNTPASTFTTASSTGVAAGAHCGFVPSATQVVNTSVVTLTVARRCAGLAAHWTLVRSPRACPTRSQTGRLTSALASPSTGRLALTASQSPSCAVVAVVCHVPPGNCRAGPSATCGGCTI
ncbi:hypothetical protein D3C72_1914310 [compost metagenome]